MGKKISIDSANMMNKILEVIEASLIFNFPISKFKIIIHPQSLIHAVVEFKNGLSSMLYHYNDMKIPIANSLYSNFYINKTSGITGCPGKCPLKKKSVFLMFITPVAEIIGTISVNLSINKNGFL